MKPNGYDALLEQRRIDPAEIARRREAERLAEIARNMASLEALRTAGEAEASAPDSAEVPTIRK